MLPWFTKYPNQNDEILNLDWVIRQVENLKAAYEAFVAADSLSFADPIQWDITKQYSKNTIVLSPEGDAFLSKKAVGKGIQLNNTEYWLEIFNFADYVRTANANFTMNIELNTERASKAYAVDDWVLWEDILYKVIVAIPADGLLIVNTNLVHFTVEDFCRAWQTYMVNTIAQYKADIDASELAYKQQLDQTVLQYKNDIDASELAYRNQLAGDIASTTASLQAQLNTAISGATVDSEVINIRVAYGGHVYDTAGDAVRAQVEFLNNKAYMERGPVISGGRVTCGACTLPGTYTFTTSDADNITDLPASWYGGGLLQVFTSGAIMWQILKNGAFSFIRYGSNGQWVNYKENDFTIKGNVIDLGYTSLGQCDTTGLYVFTAANAANITDLPYNWQGGGYLVVYKSGTTLWQEVHNNLLSFTRYSTSGNWVSLKDRVNVKYISGAGADDSTEHIDISIKSSATSDYFTRFRIGHCKNVSKNADVWRIVGVYAANLNQLSEVAITRSGEFECAVKLNGRSDFAGGIIHGNEIDQSVTFIGDGKVLTKTNVGNVYNEFKIVRTSYLYDPNDSETVIAEHGVEYIFTINGLKVNQSLKWLVAQSLSNCYLAMYPVIKTFSGYRYTDTSYEVESNPASDFTDTFNDAKSVTEYGNNFISTVSILEYPTGLTGGDCAVISDNGGLDYNKIYFTVCSSGSSSVNELWKASTEYTVIS